MTAPVAGAPPVATPPPLLFALLKLAGPVALARLGVIAMGVTDVVMVGQLAPAELPAQALGWSPVGVLLLAGIGLLTGVQVLSGLAYGSRRPEEAGIVLRRGLWLAGVAGALAGIAVALLAEPLLLAFGIAPELARAAAPVAQVLGLSIPLQLAFSAGSYFLEGVQRPNATTLVMWLANLINIGLNWALIPEHGAVGSAWATVGSRLFLVVALLAWIAWMPGREAFRPFARSTIPGPGFGDLLRIGGAAALSQAAEAGAFSGMTVIAGRISAEAVAAYQVLLNAMAVVFMLALGFAAASAVLVAEARGQGDRSRARKAGLAGVLCNSVVMLACAGVMLVFAGPIAGAFTADPSIAALAVAAIPFAAVALTPDGAQAVLSHTLRAHGDNWFPTASHILAYVFVMPPLGWWLGEHLGKGVSGLLEAIFWASVLSAAVLGWRLMRLSR